MLPIFHYNLNRTSTIANYYYSFAEPLQHALIHEADNVADSEDSEDEWNYYRVDPNKEKDTATPVDKPEELRNEENIKIPEDPVEDAESKIQSDDIEQEVKSENPKEESPELINTEVYQYSTVFLSIVSVLKSSEKILFGT